MIKKNLIFLLILSLPVYLFSQEKPAESESSDLIFERYNESFLAQSLEQIIELYAQDAIMITQDGTTFNGQDEIRLAYEGAFNYLPDSLSPETLSLTIEKNLFHHVYSMWDGESGEQLVPFSSETVLLDKGKIKYHTIAQYYPEIESPVSLSLPENWTDQTSLLPRHFAPDLYEGIADYAFAPGMFDPEADDYFTYAMVFWLPIDTDVSRQKLQQDLEVYFDGLAAAALPGINRDNANKKVDQLFDSLATKHSVSKGNLRANVILEPASGKPDWEKSYKAGMNIYEALAAHTPIKLNSRINLKKCQASGHRVIYLEISPQPFSHRTWNTLDEMARQWKCPEE